MFEIDHDDLWPRDLAHRFRLYGVIAGGFDVLAAAPTMAGIGLAIWAIHDDQRQIGRRLADLGRTGILDVVPDPPNPRGEWIVLPFDRGA